MFVSHTSKPLCLLTLSLAPLREAHWAASNVVFKMFLHFWPRFSGTKVFLSTTSLMPGFYRWLLNTGGTPQEALPQLKSPRFPLSLTRAAEALMAHAPPWHEPARDRAAAALHQATAAARSSPFWSPSRLSLARACARCTAWPKGRRRAKQARGRQSRLSHVCTF